MSEETQAAANLQAVATAAAQGERLAVVETEIKGIRVDISEVKTDIKAVRTDVSALVASESRFQGGAGLISRVAPWIAVAISVAAVLRTS